jgi:hypothetical protein
MATISENRVWALNDGKPRGCTGQLIPAGHLRHEQAVYGAQAVGEAFDLIEGALSPTRSPFRHGSLLVSFESEINALRRGIALGQIGEIAARGGLDLCASTSSIVSSKSYAPVRCRPPCAGAKGARAGGR